MNKIPYFLHRLELDDTADQRAIRGAYARALKKIDQENDTEGFQSLRTAYEAALTWAKVANDQAPLCDAATTLGKWDLPYDVTGSGLASVEAQPDVDLSDTALSDIPLPDTPLPDMAPPHPPPSDAVPSIDAPCHTDEVAPVAPIETDETQANVTEAFVHFIGHFRSAVSADHSTDPEVWQARLEHCLASDHFVNVMARDMIEQQFADLLTQGWKRGHEILFVVATNVFCWEENRQHLQRMGSAGLVLDSALQERAVFSRQQSNSVYSQDALMRRLRNGASPTVEEIDMFFESIEVLTRNFSNWLSIVTDTTQLQLWHEQCSATPTREMRAPEGAKVPPAAHTKLIWTIFIIVVMVSMLVNAMRH